MNGTDMYTHLYSEEQNYVHGIRSIRQSLLPQKIPQKGITDSTRETTRF